MCTGAYICVLHYSFLLTWLTSSRMEPWYFKVYLKCSFVLRILSSLLCQFSAFWCLILWINLSYHDMISTLGNWGHRTMGSNTPLSGVLDWIERRGAAEYQQSFPAATWLHVHDGNVIAFLRPLPWWLLTMENFPLKLWV